MAIFTAYGWYAIILAAIIICTMFPIIAQVLLGVCILLATAVAKYGAWATIETIEDTYRWVVNAIRRIPWRDLHFLFFAGSALYSFACSVAFECDPMAQKIALCCNIIWALMVAWPIACILAEH